MISIDPELVTRVGRAEAVDNQVLGNDPARVKALIGSGAEDTPDMSKAVETPEAPTGHAALGVTVEAQPDASA